MIKHIRLLELYLSTSYDIQKARKEIIAIYIRFLIVAELSFLLITTPAAFIAANGLLVWMILVSIFLIPRWKEAGFKLRYYFLPLIIMLLVTTALMPVISPYIGRGFENVVVLMKKPLFLIIPGFLLIIAYSLHNSEREDTPKITLAKRILLCVLLVYFLVFAISSPLRDWLVKTFIQ